MIPSNVAHTERAQGPQKIYTPLLERAHPQIRMRRTARPYKKPRYFPGLHALAKPREESQALPVAGVLLVVVGSLAMCYFVLWEHMATGGDPAGGAQVEAVILTEPREAVVADASRSSAADSNPSQDVSSSLGGDPEFDDVRYFVLR